MSNDYKEISNHELFWMLQDSVALVESGRRYSAILLLLCAVDALAKRRFPENEKVGDRFEEFLKEQMRREGRPQVHNIQVPTHGELMTLERILYKYLRNPLVHEGARLELNHPKGYTVQIDWVSLPYGMLIVCDIV